jgi:hypothetical protein
VRRPFDEPIGEKAGEQAPRDAKLPMPAGLNMMA